MLDAYWAYVVDVLGYVWEMCGKYLGKAFGDVCHLFWQPIVRRPCQVSVLSGRVYRVFYLSNWVARRIMQEPFAHGCTLFCILCRTVNLPHRPVYAPPVSGQLSWTRRHVWLCLDHFWGMYGPGLEDVWGMLQFPFKNIRIFPAGCHLPDRFVPTVGFYPR